MDNETINKYARDTLNALIAGGYFPKEILIKEKNETNVKLDAPYLRAVENLLREYYTVHNEENHLLSQDID